MISVSFLHKVFMVYTIFMIVILVSTKTIIYRMVRKNENVDMYRKSIPQTYETKLNISQLYYTIHNSDHRRIPEPFQKYNYKEYELAMKKYCAEEYITLQHFTKEYQLLQFKDAVSDMEQCLLNEKQRQNQQPSSDIKPKKNLLSQFVTAIRSCQNPKDNKTGIQICAEIFRAKFDDILSIAERQKIYKEPVEIGWEVDFNTEGLNKAENLAAKFLSFPEIPEIEKDSVYYETWFKQYTGFTQDVETTANDRAKCLKELNALKSFDYTAMKMAYMLFPSFTNVDKSSHLKFVALRKQLILNLWSVDYKNEDIYKEYISLTDTIPKNNFGKIVYRRAFIEEKDYNVYVLRMNLKGYYPLPTYLWTEEQSISGNSFYASELQIDLQLENDKQIQDATITTDTRERR